MSWNRLRAVMAAAVLAATITALASCSDGDSSAAVPRYTRVDDEVGRVEYHVVIPDGTQERIDAGEEVELLPAEFIVTVGETIRIVNHDVAAHSAGPFHVGPGETMTQTFAASGEYTGACSLHPSGQITLRVEDA